MASEELIRRLDVLTKAIYELDCTGCCLHVVLDDKNWQRDHVESALESARHGICREVAELLLQLTEEERELALGEIFINYQGITP